MIDQTGAVWRKSARSGNGGDCVEVATNLHAASGHVLVRDSKDHGSGPVLQISTEGWRDFLAGVRDGEFDA